MAATTSIQWADRTFNPWRGCVKISPGCANCYAERMAKRNPAILGRWGEQGARVFASRHQWDEVKRWNRIEASRRILVFCASLSDVFEDWGSGQMTDSQGRLLYRRTNGLFPSTDLSTGGQEYTLNHARELLWEWIRWTPNLRWQLLTKRPENISRMMPAGDWPNVWLGATVESQEYLWRLDELALAPQRVPVRFASFEPLLGPIDAGDSLSQIQWAILGGESGSQARSMHLDWVTSLAGQCERRNVPVFLKQLGRSPVHGQGVPLRMLHDPSHGGDMTDWPLPMWKLQDFPIEPSSDVLRR